MKKIVGIFNTEENAVNAIENLKVQGVRDNEISVITEDEESYQAIKNRTGMDVEEGPDVPSGTVRAAATGGTIGGLGGLLLGLGALAIPGIGPIVAAGPIASALMGTLAGGAVGGLAAAFKEHGIAKDEAHVYEERIHQGDIMILVEDNDNKERREAVHENFRKNDSYIKHPNRSQPAEKITQQTGDTGNTNSIRDSYQERNLPTGEGVQHDDSRNIYGDNKSDEVNPFKDISLDPHEDERSK